MNPKLLHMLNAMVANLEVLNTELIRLCRSEQFNPDASSYDLISRIRTACLGNMDSIRTLEKLLIRQEKRRHTGSANNNDPLAD